MSYTVIKLIFTAARLKFYSLIHRILDLALHNFRGCDVNGPSCNCAVWQTC